MLPAEMLRDLKRGAKLYESYRQGIELIEAINQLYESEAQMRAKLHDEEQRLTTMEYECKVRCDAMVAEAVIATQDTEHALMDIEDTLNGDILKLQMKQTELREDIVRLKLQKSVLSDELAVESATYTEHIVQLKAQESELRMAIADLQKRFLP
jgi:hypothetical protein